MRVLITAGPTREPIDAVRYIGNRSSGKMGSALAQASLKAGHVVTVILGPVAVHMTEGIRRLDVETAAQMHAAVMREFPTNDLLIMAAAVADYCPKTTSTGKLPRHGNLTIECEATQDIVADAGRIKRADQRTVGFSLEVRGDTDRARKKLLAKQLDLIVYNPTQTMESESIEPMLLWPDGRVENIAALGKETFAELLLLRAAALFRPDAA
jgi:phosphopantothenoylcysteine decarboxylase/phosphopantothenate--cysteine ligase